MEAKGLVIVGTFISGDRSFDFLAGIVDNWGRTLS